MALEVLLASSTNAVATTPAAASARSGEASTLPVAVAGLSTSRVQTVALPDSAEPTDETKSRAEGTCRTSSPARSATSCSRNRAAAGSEPARVTAL